LIGIVRGLKKMPFADDHFYTQYDAMVGSLVSKYAQKEPLFVHRAASVNLGSFLPLAARKLNGRFEI
jgi:hypothetical protein